MEKKNDFIKEGSIGCGDQLKIAKPIIISIVGLIAGFMFTNYFILEKPLIRFSITTYILLIIIVISALLGFALIEKELKNRK